MASLEQTPRTAIVTGSGRGIGLAIAVQLAKDGYDVCINDIVHNQKDIDAAVKQIEAVGRKAIGVAADVSKADQVEELVQQSVKELGPLTMMVANAGIAVIGGFLDTSDEDFDRLININIKGVRNSYKSAAKAMIKEGKGGRIVGATSAAGLSARLAVGLGYYAATKFAVRALTQAAALEFGPHDITVNAYAPGIIDTDMWVQIDGEATSKTNAPKGSIFQSESKKNTVLGRPGTPADVAHLVSFFGKPENGYVTGQTFAVDGGIFFS